MLFRSFFDLKSLFTKRGEESEDKEEQYDLLPRHSPEEHEDEDSPTEHEGSNESEEQDGQPELTLSTRNPSSRWPSRLQRTEFYEDVPDHRKWMWMSLGLGFLSFGLMVGNIVCNIDTHGMSSPFLLSEWLNGMR